MLIAAIRVHHPNLPRDRIVGSNRKNELAAVWGPLRAIGDELISRERRELALVAPVGINRVDVRAICSTVELKE
jgi:hypothetical protein